MTHKELPSRRFHKRFVCLAPVHKHRTPRIWFAARRARLWPGGKDLQWGGKCFEGCGGTQPSNCLAMKRPGDGPGAEKVHGRILTLMPCTTRCSTFTPSEIELRLSLHGEHQLQRAVELRLENQTQHQVEVEPNCQRTSCARSKDTLSNGAGTNFPASGIRPPLAIYKEQLVCHKLIGFYLNHNIQ